ncbi:hypothetical protein QTP70_028054 [Hemibagrus guttatus]|uniref:Fibronectin type-III domain-containing protein n=1 Tax=Hemibagrus guttatus TaxID=175788 RepID=A0AAE0UYW8_9TELE|nr:hypothetical protein QTP70_028054 [Hemibagrus guttatus]
MSYLEVTPESQSDFGSYNCTATNVIGSDSKEFMLISAEMKAMEEYINEALATGYIRSSTSSAATSFFFMGKKDGGLCPSIDYRGLNAIMVHYPYPLPLVPAALEQLRGAKIFTKLDLCSAYNQFQFSITYRPGSKNSKADALSRRYDTVNPPSQPEPIILSSAIIDPVSWNLLEEIQQAHVEDPPPTTCPADLLNVLSTQRQSVLQWVHGLLSSGESSEVPTVDEWFRRSREIWERAHIHVPSAPVIERVEPYPSTAMVEFEEPEFDGGVPVLKYKAEWRTKGQDWVSKVYIAEEGNCIGSITIVGLKPETEYEVMMSAINGKGEGESCSPETFKTLPVSNKKREPNPPKLEVKLQSPGNEMKVSWIKQDDGGSPIKQYLVSYRPVSMMGYEKNHNNWKTVIRVPNGGEFYVLRGLDWNTEYEVSVVAENQQGRSDPGTLFFRTSAEPTAIPDLSETDIVAPEPSFVGGHRSVRVLGGGRRLKLLLGGGRRLVLRLGCGRHSALRLGCGRHSALRLGCGPRSAPPLGCGRRIGPFGLAVGSFAPPTYPVASGTGLGTGAIVGILIVVFLLLLVGVDITCYFLNKCGLLMCIAVNFCGKSGPSTKGKDIEEGKAAFTKDESKEPIVEVRTEEERTPNHEGGIPAEPNETTPLTDPEHAADTTATVVDLLPSLATNSESITDSPASESTTLNSSTAPAPDPKTAPPSQTSAPKASIISPTSPPADTPLVDLSDGPSTQKPSESPKSTPSSSKPKNATDAIQNTDSATVSQVDGGAHHASDADLANDSNSTNAPAVPSQDEFPENALILFMWSTLLYLKLKVRPQSEYITCLFPLPHSSSLIRFKKGHGKIAEDGKSKAPETDVKKPSAEVKTVPNEAPQTNGNESKA